jgi:hypothetical protein
MEAIQNPIRARLLRRVGLGAIVMLAALIAGVAIARAAEIVPAVGLMRLKGTHDTRTFGSLALRGDLLPAVQTELAVAYRNEGQVAAPLQVRMWPVTASLWLTPLPALYAGGGVGWYHTTLDYDSSVPFADETREEFGVHLGGGLKVPIAPVAAIDLGGRYVMMREQDSHLVPRQFKPDFWMSTLGLAVRF